MLAVARRRFQDSELQDIWDVRHGNAFDLEKQNLQCDFLYSLYQRGWRNECLNCVMEGHASGLPYLFPEPIRLSRLLRSISSGGVAFAPNPSQLDLAVEKELSSMPSYWARPYS